MALPLPPLLPTEEGPRQASPADFCIANPSQKATINFFNPGDKRRLLMARVNAIVKGRVQGVGFRYFVYEMAQHFDIRGFVRNLPHGQVEIEAEADAEVLDNFLKRIEEGPRFALIESMETQWGDEKGYSNFRITF